MGPRNPAFVLDLAVENGILRAKAHNRPNVRVRESGFDQEHSAKSPVGVLYGMRSAADNGAFMATVTALYLDCSLSVTT